MAISATKKRQARWNKLATMQGDQAEKVNAYATELLQPLFAAYASTSPENPTDREARKQTILDFVRTVVPDDLVRPLALSLSSPLRVQIENLTTSKRAGHISTMTLRELAVRAFADNPEQTARANDLIANPNTPFQGEGIQDFIRMLEENSPRHD